MDDRSRILMMLKMAVFENSFVRIDFRETLTGFLLDYLGRNDLAFEIGKYLVKQPLKIKPFMSVFWACVNRVNETDAKLFREMLPAVAKGMAHDGSNSYIFPSLGLLRMYGEIDFAELAAWLDNDAIVDFVARISWAAIPIIEAIDIPRECETKLRITFPLDTKQTGMLLDPETGVLPYDSLPNGQFDIGFMEWGSTLYNSDGKSRVKFDTSVIFLDRFLRVNMVIPRFSKTEDMSVKPPLPSKYVLIFGHGAMPKISIGQKVGLAEMVVFTKIEV